MKPYYSAIFLIGHLMAPIANAQTVWTLASAYSDTTFHTANLRQFVTDVALNTDEKVKINLKSNGTYAPMAQIAGKVETGQVQAGEVIMSALAQGTPIAGIDSVAFVTSTYSDARRLWQAQRPVLDAALAKRGLIALYAVAWPPQGLYVAQPLHRLSDMQGMRMRTYNTATQHIAQQLGAKPIDVTAADLPAALAAGRIDSMITSAATGVDVHAWEHFKYFYDVHAWYPKNVVLVNAAAFDALDARSKAAIRQAAAAAEERGWRMSEETASASLAALAANGIHIEPVEFTFRTDLRQQGEHMSLEYVRATGQSANAILIPYFSGTR